jgi:hypothetical protein
MAVHEVHDHPLIQCTIGGSVASHMAEWRETVRDLRLRMTPRQREAFLACGEALLAATTRSRLLLPH